MVHGSRGRKVGFQERIFGNDWIDMLLIQVGGNVSLITSFFMPLTQFQIIVQMFLLSIVHYSLFLEVTLINNFGLRHVGFMRLSVKSKLDRFGALVRGCLYSISNSRGGFIKFE